MRLETIYRRTASGVRRVPFGDRLISGTRKRLPPPVKRTLRRTQTRILMRSPRPMLSVALTPSVRNRLLADADTVQALLDSPRGREIVDHSPAPRDHGIDWVKQVVLNDPAEVVAAFEDLAVAHHHVDAALQRMASKRTGVLSSEQIIDVFLALPDEAKRAYWKDRRIRKTILDDLCSDSSLATTRAELGERIDAMSSPGVVRIDRGDAQSPEIGSGGAEPRFGVEVPAAADLLVEVDRLDYEQLWAIAAFRRAFIDRLTADDLAELKGLLSDARLSNPETRAALFDALADSRPLQIASADGEIIVLPSADIGFAKAFWADHRSELANLDRLSELKGETRRGLFVDVGANLATHSIHALTSCGFDEALLIEPDPRLLPLLKANIALNSLDNRVRVVECAAAAEPGVMELSSSMDNWGDNRLGKITGDEWTISTVRVKTLDQILLDQGIDADHVGVLWIDAQGHEEDVLRGAPSLLSGGCDVVAEFWPAVLDSEGRLASTIDTLVGVSNTWLELSSGRTLDRDGLEEISREGIAEGESYYVDLAALRSR